MSPVRLLNLWLLKTPSVAEIQGFRSGSRDGYGMSQSALDRVGFTALRLSPCKDCLYYVRGKTGQRQEPTDIRVRHTVLCSEVGDPLRLTILDPAPPTVGADERLDDRLVAAASAASTRCRQAR